MNMTHNTEKPVSTLCETHTNSVITTKICIYSYLIMVYLTPVEGGTVSLVCKLS